MENKKQMVSLTSMVTIIALACLSVGAILAVLRVITFVEMAFYTAVGFIVGTLVATAVYIELSYSREAKKAKEQDTKEEQGLKLALDNKMDRIYGRAIFSKQLGHLKKTIKGRMVTFWLYEGNGVSMTFSVGVTDSGAVEFRTRTHDIETGKAMERTLTLANLDDEELDHNAFRYLDDPEFVRTLTPLSRQVRA